MLNTVQNEVEMLLAKEAIRDLVYRYCNAVDRCDMALIRKLYHDDALDEHGVNPTQSAREFIAAIPGLQKSIHIIQHHVTNLIIKVDGEDAEGEAYVIAYHSFDHGSGPTLLITGGRYLDRYQRREGIWKIAHRRCVTDWGHTFPVKDLDAAHTFTDPLPAGCRGPDDPSYAFFNLLRRGERTG
jgi:ketosteroid isomerase-like protein